MPGWKRDVGRRLDALIVRTVPDVRKAVRWNSPFYGIEGRAGSSASIASRSTSRWRSSAARRCVRCRPSSPSTRNALLPHPRGRPARRGARGELDQAGIGAARLDPVAPIGKETVPWQVTSRGSRPGWSPDILLDVDVRDRPHAFEVVAAAIGSLHGLDPAPILRALWRREQSRFDRTRQAIRDPARPHQRGHHAPPDAVHAHEVRHCLRYTGQRAGAPTCWSSLVPGGRGEKDGHLKFACAWSPRLFSDRVFGGGSSTVLLTRQRPREPFVTGWPRVIDAARLDPALGNLPVRQLIRPWKSGFIDNSVKMARTYPQPIRRFYALPALMGLASFTDDIAP